MQSSSTSRVPRVLLLLPVAYLAATRLRSWRDLAYLVASSIVPAWWLLVRLSGLSLPAASLDFAAGYVCFISLYEIGYLANDAWDAQRGGSSRRRLAFTPTPAFCLIFVVLRLAVWAALGAAMGWIGKPVWLCWYAALAVVFCEHNLIRSGALRSASFIQLAVLRFSAPVVAVLDERGVALTVIAAILFYAYLRFLSYLESKDVLAMPERKGRRFALVQSVMMLPLAAVIAYACRASVLIEIALYFVVVYGLWSVAAWKQGAPGQQ